VGTGAWAEADHPRDSKGQFTSGEVSATAAWVQSKFKSSPEGFSSRPDTGDAKSGIMVAEHPDRDLGAVIDSSTVTAEELDRTMRDWVKKALPEIKKDPDMHFGGWLHEGKFYPDVSKRYPESKEKEAIAAGKANNQIGIYHVGRGEVIPTGGTGEKTRHK
jgi:hypothetical protein